MKKGRRKPAANDTISVYLRKGRLAHTQRERPKVHVRTDLRVFQCFAGRFSLLELHAQHYIWYRHLASVRTQRAD